MRYVILGVAAVLALTNIATGPIGATIRSHWNAETERHARNYDMNPN